MLVLGLSSKASEEKYDSPYYYEQELIVQVNDSIWLCDLGPEVKSLQSSKYIDHGNIETLIPMFQYSAEHLIRDIIKNNELDNKMENLLYELICYYTQSELNPDKCEVFPYLYLWSDSALPYLSYYGIYNYNKNNIVKRIVGFTMPRKGGRYREYKPWYFGKQFKHVVSVKSNCDHQDRLSFFLSEHVHQKGGYVHGLDSMVAQDLEDNKVITVVLQSKKILELFKSGRRSFPFLSSNKAITSQLIVVTKAEQSTYRSYTIQVNAMHPDPEKIRDSDMFIALLYLATLIGNNTINHLKKWFRRLDSDWASGMSSITLISNAQLLVSLYRNIEQEQHNHKNQIIHLVYMEIFVVTEMGRYNFIIIGTKEVIYKYKIYTIEYSTSFNTKIKRVFKLLKNKKSLVLEWPRSDNFKIVLVFVYE